MIIIEKLGGIKNVYNILKNKGYNKKYHAFYMQIKRKKLSKEVILLLLGNFKSLSPSDFYEDAEK